MACHHVCAPEVPSINLSNRLRVNPFPHHLQGEPNIAALAVILGVVLPVENPIRNRPRGGQAPKLLLMKPERDEVVVP